MSLPDPHEMLADWLEDRGDDLPNDSVVHDATAEYRQRHPECAATATRATVLALADLEAHMPARLRGKVWPPEGEA